MSDGGEMPVRSRCPRVSGAPSSKLIRPGRSAVGGRAGDAVTRRDMHRQQSLI